MESVHFFAFVLAVSVYSTLAKPGWQRKLAQDYDSPLYGASQGRQLKRLNTQLNRIDHVEKDMDKNENGFVEKKEAMKFLKEKFMKADLNNDGELNEAELKVFRSEGKEEVAKDEDVRMLKRDYQNPQNQLNGGARAKFQQKQSNPQTEQMEKDLDVNENGLVEKEEILKAMLSKYKKADRNHDGKLNKGDLKIFHSEMKEEVEKDEHANMLRTSRYRLNHNGGARSGYKHQQFDAEAKHMEKDLDVNKDGLVEMDEIVKAVVSKYNEADRNHDEELNEDDLKILQSEMKEEVDKDEANVLKRTSRDRQNHNGRARGDYQHQQLEPEAKQMEKDLDVNKDGLVEMDEIVKAVVSKFNKADRNHDEELNKDDLKILQYEMKEEVEKDQNVY